MNLSRSICARPCVCACLRFSYSNLSTCPRAGDACVCTGACMEALPIRSCAPARKGGRWPAAGTHIRNLPLRTRTYARTHVPFAYAHARTRKAHAHARSLACLRKSRLLYSSAHSGRRTDALTQAAARTADKPVGTDSAGAARTTGKIVKQRPHAQQPSKSAGAAHSPDKQVSHRTQAGMSTAEQTQAH